MQRRLMGELRELRKGKTDGVDDEGVWLRPRDDQLRQWVAFLLGPPDSPYQDRVFELRVSVPERYPMRPPEMRFVTRVFHPNVHWQSGEICLDILKEEWSPIWTLESACRAVRTLLAHPAADSPLNCDAGNMLRAEDTAVFESLAAMYATELADTLPQHRSKITAMEDC
ncbi:MAG: hypothetical protein MHM6MM_007372 [Cercozoa sp. M6MM]